MRMCVPGSLHSCTTWLPATALRRQRRCLPRRRPQAQPQAFDRAAPALIVAEGAQLDAVMDVANVETEIRIEAFGGLQIRHRQHEMVERMNPDLAFMHRALDIAARRRHTCLPSLLVQG